MNPSKEYALICEFATMSVNGLQSYLHVFDRTTFQPGAPVALRGFFATRLVHLPEENDVEVYVTDGKNTLVDGGQLFKNKIKGPAANLVARIPGLQVKSTGEYRIWARINGGEPVQLCTWEAVAQS
jgi:hypothetical protein